MYEKVINPFIDTDTLTSDGRSPLNHCTIVDFTSYSTFLKSIYPRSTSV